MQHLLYSPASLRFYRYYQYMDDVFHGDFSTVLDKLKVFMAQRGYVAREICVVGSGVLEACGVRMPRDIDVVATRFVERKSDEMVEVLRDYSLNTPTFKISTVELIKNPSRHFLFNGIKFADANFVCIKKKISGKPKDGDDLQLVRKHLKKIRDAQPSSFLRNELLWLEAGVRQGFQ